MTDRTIVGAVGSPYSRKLRAALRYRRIPHRWVQQGTPEARELPQPKVPLLPRLVGENAAGEIEALTDTTPLLRDLERGIEERPLLPADPVVAYVDALLEDFADEWVTKAMFHYRWAFAPDIARACAILPRWFRTDLPEDQARAMGEQFGERQIERLWVVGSNETTAPVIEASYHRLLALLDARLTVSPFLLGSRPGAADFAFYGQLTQLVGFDPTPSAIALAEAPRVVAWVDWLDDLSGLELDGRAFIERAALAEAAGPLLSEVGRLYVPFLLANADALARRAEQVECKLDDCTWVQRPFPYQGKCLVALREGAAALSRADRDAVAGVLEGTGCEPLLG